jgi:hypothetical protein
LFDVAVTRFGAQSFHLPLPNISPGHWPWDGSQLLPSNASSTARSSPLGATDLQDGQRFQTPARGDISLSQWATTAGFPPHMRRVIYMLRGPTASHTDPVDRPPTRRMPRERSTALYPWPSVVLARPRLRRRCLRRKTSRTSRTVTILAGSGAIVGIRTPRGETRSRLSRPSPVGLQARAGRATNQSTPLWPVAIVRSPPRGHLLPRMSLATGLGPGCRPMRDMEAFRGQVLAIHSELRFSFLSTSRLHVESSYPARYAGNHRLHSTMSFGARGSGGIHSSDINIPNEAPSLHILIPLLF